MCVVGVELAAGAAARARWRERRRCTQARQKVVLAPPACGRVLRHLFASPRGIYSRHACLAITSPARRLGGHMQFKRSQNFSSTSTYKVVTDS